MIIFFQSLYKNLHESDKRRILRLFCSTEILKNMKLFRKRSNKNQKNRKNFPKNQKRNPKNQKIHIDILYANSNTGIPYVHVYIGILYAKSYMGILYVSLYNVVTY